MQKTLMPTTAGILEKIQLHWLHFSRQAVWITTLKVQDFGKMSQWDRNWRMLICMLTFPYRHFQKIFVTQQWFALVAESQTYGFKQSLSQWLTLSQLSDHIRLCNHGCSWGASDNSSLCGVSRKWDLLRGPLCALSICLRSVTLGQSDFFPRLTTLTWAALYRTEGANKSLWLLLWITQRPLCGHMSTYVHVHRESWAAELNCTLDWEKKGVICSW